MFTHDELQLLWMIAGAVLIAAIYVGSKPDLKKKGANVIFVDIAYFGLACALMLIPFALVRMLLMGALNVEAEIVHPFWDGIVLAVVTAVFRECLGAHAERKRLKKVRA